MTATKATTGPMTTASKKSRLKQDAPAKRKIDVFISDEDGQRELLCANLEVTPKFITVLRKTFQNFKRRTLREHGASVR